MKKRIYLFLLAIFFTPMTFANDYYISDELFTYMHSGPGTQYRIIGSINAGSTVTLLSKSPSNGFIQIMDQRGRQGWVENKFVTQTPTSAIRLNQVERELASTKRQLKEERQQFLSEKTKLTRALEFTKKDITDLKGTQERLQQMLSNSREEIDTLNAKLDTKGQDRLFRYFLYGGGVAGVGLLFGLLLPHMIPRKKKQRW